MMTNMKVQRSDIPDATGATTLATDESEYPYGLRIYLEESSLAALNVTELPKIGATFTIQAKVEVVGAGKNPSRRDGEGRSLSLQITDMSMDSDEKSDTDVANRIYTVPITGNTKA